MKYPCLIIFFVVTFFRHVIAVCTPQNRDDLILARDGCLGETGDGSCPKFAARSNSNGCGADSGVNGVIGNWDISRVKSLNSMFYGKSEFNANLTNWQTGAVTDMRHSTCFYFLLKKYKLLISLFCFWCHLHCSFSFSSVSLSKSSRTSHFYIFHLLSCILLFKSSKNHDAFALFSFDI